MRRKCPLEKTRTSPPTARTLATTRSARAATSRAIRLRGSRRGRPASPAVRRGSRCSCGLRSRRSSTRRDRDRRPRRFRNRRARRSAGPLERAREDLRERDPAETLAQPRARPPLSFSRSAGCRSGPCAGPRELHAVSPCRASERMGNFWAMRRQWNLVGLYITPLRDDSAPEKPRFGPVRS